MFILPERPRSTDTVLRVRSGAISLRDYRADGIQWTADDLSSVSGLGSSKCEIESNAILRQ